MSAQFHVYLEWPSSVSQETVSCHRWWGRGIPDEADDREKINLLPQPREDFSGDDHWSEEEKRRRQHPPVVIKAPPTCVIGRAKERLEIPCRVVGYPIPTITWSKYEGFIREDVYVYTTIRADSRKLTFRRLSYTDRGTYFCHISNSLNYYHSFEVEVLVDDVSKFCGRLADVFARTKRIAGGSETGSISQWPWQALVTYDPAVWSNSDSFCGGSIVDRRAILTAYHCTVRSVITEERFNNKDFIITVGAYNRTLVNESTRQVFGAQQVYRLLPADDISRDLSLLVLNETIRFNEHVRPVCLPSLSETVPGPGTQCIVSGYGLLSSTSRPSDVLRSVTVPLTSWEECRNRFGSYVTAQTICAAAGKDGRGTCPNDSGGPLVCLRNRTGQWFQVGVVSGGGCNEPGDYNFYGSVVENRHWIRNPI